MASELFLLPFRPALDANAIVIPGASLYFYASGTTTPQEVYADAELTVSLGYIVQSNAAGVWPAIYIDKAKIYRVVMRDADGAIVPGSEADPYIPGVVDNLAPEIAENAALATAAATALVTYTFGYIGIDDPVPPVDIEIGDGYVYTTDARVFGAVKTGPTAGSTRFEILTAASLGNAGGDIISFQQSGPDAVKRSMQAKGREVSSPTDYDGTDTEKFNAAKATLRNITLPAGSIFTIGGVVLSNSQSISGGGAIINGAPGSVNAVVLTDFNSRVEDVYFSNTDTLSGAAIRIKQGRFASVRGVTAPNAKNGFIDFTSDDPSTGSVAWGNVSQCRGETIDKIGINIGSSVNDFAFSDVSVFGSYGTGSGGYKPFPGSIGWKQDTPVFDGRAVGGHVTSNLVLINFNKGMFVNDGQLTKHSNIIIDGCSNWGLEVTGSSQDMDFSDLFVGTTRGIRVAGSSKVNICGLRTIFNGLVPPGGGTDFYDGTPWDMLIEGTAQVTVSGGWRGNKKISVAPTAKLVLDCGTKFYGASGGVLAGQTTYIIERGVTASEDAAVWRIPYTGKVVGITVLPTASPGASQSFTYTLRKNFADTALSVNLSGSTALGGDNWSPTGIDCAFGDVVALKLVTSSGAAIVFHQIIIHYVAD